MTGIFNHDPMNGKNGLTATPPNVNSILGKRRDVQIDWDVFCLRKCVKESKKHLLTVMIIAV